MAIFQADPKEYHYAIVKMIFGYLKGASDYDIWYDKSNDFTLCTYTNVDWVKDIDDRKRTSGGAFFLGGRLVSWLSKKQDCTSKSTTKAKYVVATNNYSQFIWMKQMMKDIGITFT